MFLKPAKLGEKEIPESILSEDKKHCKKIGPCGIGKEALYLNSFYLERRFYIPVSSVSRVFKRVAMSKGGFTGKGLFATMPYLDRKSTRLNSSHVALSRMPSSA